MGRLFEKEYCTVSSVMEEPVRPCVFCLGGAKISDAFLMMQTVLERGIADTILTGGLVANIFLIALGKQIGNGSRAFICKSNYAEFFDRAKDLYRQFGDKIILPEDLAWVENGERREAPIDLIPDEISAVDIGHATAAAYREVILSATKSVPKTFCQAFFLVRSDRRMYQRMMAAKPLMRKMANNGIHTNKKM